LTHLEPIKDCECGCNDTTLDRIKRQVACFEGSESLTDEEQDQLTQARNILAVVEQLAQQGIEIDLE